MAEVSAYEDLTGLPQGHAIEIKNAEMVLASDVELIEPTPVENTDHSTVFEQKSSTLFVSPHGSPRQDHTQHEVLNKHAVEKRGLAVVVPPVERPWEYLVYEEPSVSTILGEYDDGGRSRYLVQLDDEREEVISFEELRQLPNAATLLASHNYHLPGNSESENSFQEVSLRRRRRTTGRKNANISSFVSSSSDDELISATFTKPLQRNRQPPKGTTISAMGRLENRWSSPPQPRRRAMTPESGSEGSDFHHHRTRQASHVYTERETRTRTRKNINYSDTAGLAVLSSDGSEEDLVQLGKRKRTSYVRLSLSQPRKLLPGSQHPDSSSDEGEEEEEGVRRSGRNVARRSMREVGEDDVGETTATANAVIRYIGAKESFKTLADDDDFRLRHCQTCDKCSEPESYMNGNLIYCQGCTLSYHPKCLGPRGSREHLVTKIGKKDFVLQCRRCIGLSAQKDPMSPDQGLCFSCGEPGEATSSFRDRKTTQEEQKEREENDGKDPVTDVIQDLINNHGHVLFRCRICYRACHMYHLPPKSDCAPSEGSNEEELAARRFEEYHLDWMCKDCSDAPADIESLVAWRPLNVDEYKPGQPSDAVIENMKEYLIKWKKISYFKVQWMPGAWVWGVTAPTMRTAFAKKNNSYNLPKMTTEEAVPEDYLRVDIVLDVEYTSVVSHPTEKIAKGRINDVKNMLVKFKGLAYEEVVWTEPPHHKDTERWEDFKAAYEDWVVGSYTREPVQKELRASLAKTRTEDFGASLEMKTQPSTMIGGNLMPYQLEGLNWLYYQWFKEQNAILADEMGLGKTIQVIGFLAALKEVHGCWPFLVVVPNSTCPNWRREIKQWAPSLRVVTYYGSAKARELAFKHELFPGGNKNLGCHVVVTSYDAAQHEEFRKVFRGVHWAGLVVDEGQRLKNDKSILYSALNALKPPFKLLLTGTPLQNNARELFNLLQFLDSSINAQQMEDEYANLTKENVAELHVKLRQCFLRRTKAEVLKFLPVMAQIILPVSMSSLQKELYKSILSQSPELIQSIMPSNQESLGKKEQANLNNILIQLRKCLCHPFVYSQRVEDRNPNAVISHSNLVEASSKLKLLEIMLPKLQERGHRVLIFSQFLKMLDIMEDFLDGLGLYHERLDGSVGSLQKQKKIDAFNAPNSRLFAFLLSTRAGGVGINLASADTVIILDPDFNPHQDIQALSRAHRIGQQKKVLVFQLTTRGTAEEKILQIGKKKMALDQVLIEQMDKEEDEAKDIASVLRYGAEALFKDDESQQINYSSASIDELLDRSQIEHTQVGEDQSAQSQFSFAKVWVNDKGTLEEGLGDIANDTNASGPSVWDRILRERKQAAADKAAATEKTLGRGRRERKTTSYKEIGPVLESPPGRPKNSKGRRSKKPDSDDTDYQAEDVEEEAFSAEEDGAQKSVEELEGPPPKRRSRGLLSSQASQASPDANTTRTFKRAEVPALPPRTANGTDGTNDDPCLACGEFHPRGYCPLKLAGVEYCNLCGLAHYGHATACAHLGSTTQLRKMLEALKSSSEGPELKDMAKEFVTGCIGDLNKKKRKKERELARHSEQMRAINEGESLQPLQAAPPYGGPLQSLHTVPPYGGPLQPLHTVPPYGGPLQPLHTAPPNGANGASYMNGGVGKENAMAGTYFHQPPPRR